MEAGFPLGHSAHGDFGSFQPSTQASSSVIAGKGGSALVGESSDLLVGSGLKGDHPRARDSRRYPRSRSEVREEGRAQSLEDSGLTPLSTVRSERALSVLAGLLGARTVRGISKLETDLLAVPESLPKQVVDDTVHRILEDSDPLGEVFCALRTSADRRNEGAIYTPSTIVKAMLSWAERFGAPDRVVDPGSGSGRFLVEAGRSFPKARLVGIERDPLAALTARANLAVCGFASRSEIRVEDFRDTRLEQQPGPTLFIGNPRYVRHHRIPANWKAWLKAQAADLGIRASGLAGLHAYFFLAIAKLGNPGDYGSLVTSAEWLDVNYGRLIRELFLESLGGTGIYVVNPDVALFPGTATTSAITTFHFGSRPSTIRFSNGSRPESGSELGRGEGVDRGALATAARWSGFLQPRREIPRDYVQLGELCRVHRGQVTGANRIWIAGDHSENLPAEVLYRSVTKARELLNAGPVLADASALRNVIDIPANLSVLGPSSRAAVEAFLESAERMGARAGYVARHRSAWWSVRLRPPAPILATYMARRPPAFVLNRALARHINVAHGLYPREPMDDRLLLALVGWLRDASSTFEGRVYAGGLTKFEPREMERILVPAPDVLLETVS